MQSSDIIIKGAREHNLRDVDVVLPRNKLICLTGVSGSGKSSLAFDTVYAEGQRRYVESLSSFARQFLGQMPKPDVDYIGGLSPSISISQKSTGHNPRSTVGTITEIYDYLRVLYARVGTGHCPQCDRPIASQSREQIIARILALPAGTKFMVLAPVAKAQKGEHRDLFEDLLKQGFVRARVDGNVIQLSEDAQLDRRLRHNIEVVVDRLVAKADLRPRLAEAVELALKTSGGTLIVALEDAKTERAPPPALEENDAAEESRPTKKRRGTTLPGDIVFSIDYACSDCGLSFEPPSPQLFSFNSPQGMCAHCAGLGEAFTFDPDLLIPNKSLSFKQGAIELVGTWKDMGRWQRHIYQGVADTMERKHQWAAGTLIETPWKELTKKQRDIWLQGTGEEHITFTWRQGESPVKYGGQFDGLVATFLDKYRTTKSAPHLRAYEKYMRTVPCHVCDGERLLPQSRSVRITTKEAKFQAAAALSLPQVCKLSIAAAVEFFRELQLDDTGHLIAAEVLKEIRGRLGFLINVGLEYLTLDRTAPTLSGGESQRIRLAGQIGSGLVGVTYILDEPSIGLHPRDNDRLLATLHRLRDMGNTVVVVEHDEDTMWAADHILDFGPGPGVRGGELVATGSPEKVSKTARSVTGSFLAGTRVIPIPATRRTATEKKLIIRGAEHNNLKKVDVEIPLGAFVCVTGVSGSGKSSLVNDILVEALRRDLNGGEGTPGKFLKMEGLEHLDKLIAIDQSPIGRTPRSNPGTYIKVFDDIRDLFTQLPEAKRRGYKPGRFSFNVSGGRCEACEGNGSTKLDMDFLADVWVTCPVCEGKRFSRETLQVRFKDKSIAEVLEMDVQQALELFENVPGIRHKLQTLHDVGLDYLKLGQASPTLSGGEAQRIKLARELVKRSTGRTLYLLDEPTTGLHFADIDLLLKVLQRFVEEGNTVLVVEHNLDVIKTADYLIDLGPEGGGAGGEIIAMGTPEDIAREPRSHTGRSLIPVLAGKAAEAARDKAKIAAKNAAESVKRGGVLAKEISVHGARQHNLKGVDCTIPRDRMTVFCGPSGSGKSSLAMDTIYAEGQRRYVESLSSYARQFVAQMQKPVVERIEGLSPAIAIEQKNLGHTPRSTVGTVTEIYDYLRILYARLGQPMCPACDIPVGTQTTDEIVDKILSKEPNSKLYIMCPLEVDVTQEYQSLWEELRSRGFARVRINGETHSLDTPPELSRRRKHKLEVVIDRVTVSPTSRSRIAESTEQALAFGKGVMHIAEALPETPETEWPVEVHSQHRACEQCGRSFEPLTPHNFSFNSTLGWCPTCEGLGTQVGANPAALLRSTNFTLAQGALALWPNLELPVAKAMLEALSRGTGIPLDVPYEQLTAKQRRQILHGTEEAWFEVPALHGKKNAPPLMKFQFKGLYPALEEASRVSPTFRNRLELFVGEVECGTCSGSRLRDDASAVRFREFTMGDLCRIPLGRLREMVENWKLSERERKIAGELLREISGRVQFLTDVGLEYISLSRPAATLSNGEAQRIRLASQLGSGLCGVLYVLDEPTIGLHPRDNTKLLKALHKLRDLGNTLLVVEHDREVIENCDKILDFGPRAGKLGGEIVAHGKPTELHDQTRSVTGPYISGAKYIPIPSNRRTLGANAKLAAPSKPVKKAAKPRKVVEPLLNEQLVVTELPPKTLLISVEGARGQNLKNIDLHIPLGTLTAITGPSGSGKSTLMEDTLYAALARKLHRASTIPAPHEKIDGVQHINKVIRVDQQPLGNSPASNPATFTGVFERIRDLYAYLPESKIRGYTSRRFSFNVPGGRCEACEGNGQRRIEMHFLADVWVECETCRGKRYNPETLSVHYHGRSIADVLEMTCAEALQLFDNIPAIRRILQTLCDVGLDYLTLGQPAPTLSGGEAQRVKLAAELSRPDTGRTLYLLDEPTTGLHFDDLAKLLEVMQRLVDLGNTVVVIEHNLDIIKCCDWVIDLGPEAGDGGGRIVAYGTPEAIVSHAQLALTKAGQSSGLLRSYTGEALLPVIQAGPYEKRNAFSPTMLTEEREGDKDVYDVGREAKMPWEANGRKWHTQDRVGRRGEACKWDGRILERVVDRIQELGDFSETNWNDRSVVEICGEKKSVGWFFHAITGEAWLIKMKFRVYRGTFQREELQSRIELKTLNQMDELPIYGNEPRVKVKSLQGPWQEVELRVHALDEIDTPEFWSFLEEAVQGFVQFTERAEVSKDELMPWKVLGRKWHLVRKGFPPGKKVKWDQTVLEELIDLLQEACPEGQFLWNNQQIVNLMPKGARSAWAVVWTKRPDYVQLSLTGRKGAFAYGQVIHLGESAELIEKSATEDVISFRFTTSEHLHRGDLLAFLKQHLASL
jgi:excinuclease ABC subunit A